jgi:hypothetical protein
MSFYPEKGTYSREEFSSSEGAVFVSPLLQGITGGYVTLLSTKSGTSSIIRTWREINSWTFQNNLYSLAGATGSFTVYSGNIRAGFTNRVSGSYGIEGNYGSWEFSTQYTPSGNAYSGQGSYSLFLGGTSPYTGIASFYQNGGQNLLIECDVSATESYSGLSFLPGFSEGQTNLSGLPPLSGVVGHGIAVSNGTYWDFVEVTPYGIRSFNHPEVAIPHDMRYPTRIRVGVRGNDLFLSTENGKGVLGYNKFNTLLPVAKTGLVMFGAPGKDGIIESSYGFLSGIYGSYGSSKWDNIKILTGSSSIYSNDTLDLLYSTSYVSMYSAPFDPGIHINKYLTATIGYTPFQGGTTVVHAQYSGSTGWTSHSSVTLNGNGVNQLDLSSVPVTTYPRLDFGTDYLSNPIRFKIDQKSTRGDSLAPVVSWIEVFADKENLKLDLSPDWKSSSLERTVTASIKTGNFFTEDPMPGRWTSFLFNAPNNTGVVAGAAFTDESISERVISVIGTGELVPFGVFGNSYSTYTVFPLYAISGSEAYDTYGPAAIYNAYPNGIYEGEFRPITTGELRFVSGLTEGKLAAYTRIPGGYTGQYRVNYLEEKIYRPMTAAKLARASTYGGLATTLDNGRTQGVYIYPPTDMFDGTPGIEAYTLSGIASGELNIEFDLYMPQGDGLTLQAISSNTGSWYLPGTSFRSFRSVSVPFTAQSDYPLVVRLTAVSGSNRTCKFNLDNLVINRSSNGYLTANGISGYLHLSGQSEKYISPSYSVPRAATIFNSNIYLNSYPTSTGVLFHATGAAGKGLKIEVDSRGFVKALVDHEAYSWVNANEQYIYDSFAREQLVSEVAIPLGKWTQVGFMHDVHCYDKFGNASITGDSAYNFASSNRVLLTIDGYPVASKDLMTGWRHLHTGHRSDVIPAFDPIQVDANPYLSYIPLSGNVRAVMGSGLDCYINSVKLDRPPVGDAELDLSLRGARITSPYFVPDTLYSPNGGTGNLGFRGGAAPYTSYGLDLFVGYIYNFSNPGYTHWDHGPMRNHLLFYGDIEKVDNSPIEPLYSTRFRSGYAIAPYSSAYEKLQSAVKVIYFTGGNGGVSATYEGFGNGTYGFEAMVYPYTTGSFFTLYQNSGNTTGCRLELCINTGGFVQINKYNTTSNTVVYSHTGHHAPTGVWSLVNVLVTSSGHTSYLNTGYVYSYIASESGITAHSGYGVDVGINYISHYNNSSGGSYHKIGGSADIALFNCAIPIYATGVIPKTGSYLNADKLGTYQVVLDRDNIIDSTCSGYHSISFTLPVTTGSSKRYISVPMHNCYDANPSMQGLILYDDKPFKEVTSYKMDYDASNFEEVYGTNLSPIRLGVQVPATAINVARISSPPHTTASSISTLDLSSQNTSNLNTYKEGTYLVGRASYTTSSVLSGYQNINTGLYAGRVDITISGQIVSADTEISTMAVVSSESAYPAYYYYLIGRGSRAVKIYNSYAHLSGQISEYTTGSGPDNYIANLERIKNSIKIKNRKGDIIPFDTYPYDITISQYTPALLREAVISGQSIYLDGIGPYNSGTLDDGIFSVMLLTNRKYIPNETVFVHYDAVDLYDGTVVANYKEIVNPQPIYRERYATEEKGIGKFDLTLNTNNYYDLTIYGIASGYSGNI